MSRNYICVFSTALKHRVRESKKAFWSTKKLKMDLIEENMGRKPKMIKNFNFVFMSRNYLCVFCAAKHCELFSIC